MAITDGYRRMLLKLTLFLVIFLILSSAGFVLLVGPWPVYEDSEFAEQDYHTENLARMDKSLGYSVKNESPERLHAGWAERNITPPVGTPLGGYSARPNKKMSEDIHDGVYARAIALSDGTDTVVLVGCDILMISLNIAQNVWTGVADVTPFTKDNILFTASHTHCGPGGFAPGLVAEISMGEYNSSIEELISKGITDAIIEAYKNLKPAKLTHGSVSAPEYIKNRTNVPGEDPNLDFLILINETGEECYGLRYSAHPTNFPETYMNVSAAYPGALCRAIAEKTGAMAVFLGGATGAMGPDFPSEENLDPAAKMEAMGIGLASKILAFSETLNFEDKLDIRSLGAELEMPQMQARPMPANAEWRFSPFFANLVGIPVEGWIQAVKVGDLLFLGLPYDSSGAIAQQWADIHSKEGIDLWVSGHCVAYCGYLSPDEYYFNTPEGYDQFYEWYQMNWFGPNQEAMFTVFKDHIIESII